MSQTFAHFIDVLEAQAARLAQQPAVHFLPEGTDIGATLSFGELYAQSRALAAALQLRCAPGDRVLLMLPSSLDYVRAFCACTCADVIAVPLFPPPPSRKLRHLDRVRNVIADAAPTLILCPPEACAVLAELAGPGVTVSSVEALRGEAAPSWRRPASDGEAVAFLQYTSGSTGTPKGVVVRHRNLLANLALMERAYGFDEQGRMVNWLPLYHDMGLIGGLLAPIYSGMSCYLMASQTFVQSPSVWLQALSLHRGTASFAPNFAYALCNKTVPDALLAQLDLSAWVHAINGAEPIHPGTLEAFQNRFAAAGLRATAASPGYGQAEATLCVSATPSAALPVTVRLDKAALEAGRAVPAAPGAEAVEFVACGHPQPLHEVAIVDPDTGLRCEPDAIGEIWLAGPSNAEAYWNQPEASRATFAARILGEDTAYLRSGDLGFLHQGQVVVCGRLKDLIILNGRNLFPHDIEFAVTDAEPGIRAGRLAAFAVMDAALGREKLVLVAEPHRRFVEPARHPDLFSSMQQAARELVDCAIDEIVLIEAGTIPMTTSGKISRQGARRQYLDGKLNVIGRSDQLGSGETLGPLDAHSLRALAAGSDTPVEHCQAYLAQTLRALRPGLRLDLDTSLIALGLDSIALAAFGGQLRQALGWELPLQALFNERSLGQWAEALHRHLAQVPDAADTAFPVPSSAAEAARVGMAQSYAQRRLWFLYQMHGASSGHHLVAHIRLDGSLDAQALAQRLGRCVARHAILRTVYRDGPAGPQQRVTDAVPVPLRQHDLSTLTPAAQQRAVDECLAAERSTPFDLESGPVLRAQLLRRSEQAHDLVLSLHHIAFDGRSAELLLGELADEAEPRDTSTQYADFAAWEAAHWHPERVSAELAFWREYLSGMPPRLEWNPGATSARSEALRSFHLPQALCERIAAFARERRMTLFMALLALYEVVLHHVSGQARFVLGTDVTGRPLPQFDGVIGFFVNQLPLRCDLLGDPTLAALFERVRADAQAAYAHQALPFDLLVSHLAPERVRDAAPLFQAKLNYQPARAEGLRFGAARVSGVEVLQSLGDFDLVLDLVHGAAGIDAQLKYRTDRLGAEGAERLQQLWLRLLSEFDVLLDQRLSAIRPLLQQWDLDGQRERQQAQAAAGRTQLAQIRRRSLTV